MNTENFLELKKEQMLDEKPKKWDEAECRDYLETFPKDYQKTKVIITCRDLVFSSN